MLTGLLYGWKFHNQSKTNVDVQQHLLSVCASDSRCISDLQTHYDRCFNSNYDLGGERKIARLTGRKLIDCINRRSGHSHFDYGDVSRWGL